MSRTRFDVMLRCLRFGEQPAVCPPFMSSEKYRWLRVDDFVANINLYRASNFTPGDRICVDESMCRWYGLGSLDKYGVTPVRFH